MVFFKKWKKDTNTLISDVLIAAAVCDKYAVASLAQPAFGVDVFYRWGAFNTLTYMHTQLGSIASWFFAKRG